MNKKLIIINGPMGVGKTSVCSLLHNKLYKSVWLDGDWCWKMNPWVFSDENKKMVIENIVFLLSNFLNNSNFDYVIFSWVMDDEEIFQQILGLLPDAQIDLMKITLLASESQLKKRMLKNGRSSEVIDDSLRRLVLYHQLDTVKIDTSNKSVENVANKIIDMIG